MALVVDALDSPAGGELVEVEPGELCVAGERGDVEVHTVVDAVGVALLLERADHGYLLGDVLRRPWHQVGLEATKSTADRRPTAR